MRVIADCVIQSLQEGVSTKSNKEFYIVEGVVVGCTDMPLLAGVYFKKFIKKEVFEQLKDIKFDRYDLDIGISRVVTNGKDCDLGFNLFINGLPDESEGEFVPVADDLPFDGGQATNDKNTEKGGKK